MNPRRRRHRSALRTLNIQRLERAERFASVDGGGRGAAAERLIWLDQNLRRAGPPLRPLDRPIVLETRRRLPRAFPGVQALDPRFSLTLRKGEVPGSCSVRNGAGKSTLIKNHHRRLPWPTPAPIASTARMRGSPVRAQAFAHGIGVVHQERSLVPTFTRRRKRPPRADRGQSLASASTATRFNRDARPYMEMVGLKRPAFAPRREPQPGAEAIDRNRARPVAETRASSSSTSRPPRSRSMRPNTLLETIRGLRRQGVSISLRPRTSSKRSLRSATAVHRASRRQETRRRPLRLPASIADQLIARMIGTQPGQRGRFPFAVRTDGRPVLEGPPACTARNSPIPATFTPRQGRDTRVVRPGPVPDGRNWPRAIIGRRPGDRRDGSREGGKSCADRVGRPPPCIAGGWAMSARTGRKRDCSWPMRSTGMLP